MPSRFAVVAGVVAIAIVILTAFGKEAKGVAFGTAAANPMRSSG
jgi:hypothetical protein